MVKQYNFTGEPERDEIAKVIWTAIEMGASDISIDTDHPVLVTVNNMRYPVTNPLSGSQARAFALHLVDYNHGIINRTEKSLDFHHAHQAKNINDPTQTRRFRVAGLSSTSGDSNSGCSTTARLLPLKPFLPEDINLPNELFELVKSTSQGIIMFVGGTGQGKSSSLAAIIRKILETDGLNKKIMTFEDPIEVLYNMVNKAVGNSISQHSIGESIYGSDLTSFEAALKVALRCKPNILLLGEMRDAATMRPAVAFSNSGHLLLTTLHANTAAGAYSRLFNAFPPQERDAAMFDLLTETRAVVAQTLERTVDGEMVGIREIVYNDAALRDQLIGVKNTMEVRSIINQRLKDTQSSFYHQAEKLAMNGIINLDTLQKYRNL